MTNGNENNGALETVTVRICPACGVVNPAGPSDTCPHLQLVKYQGLDENLTDLLDRLAKVRNTFHTLVTELRTTVMHAARIGVAEVEVTHKGRVSQVEALRKRPETFALSNPEPPPVSPKAPPVRKPKKPPAPKKVDPRQLALIAREPPQGDA